MRANKFLGIDLGGYTRKTTGICFFTETKNGIEYDLQEDIKGKKLFKNILPHLESTQTIAIDCPLTLGKEGGGMRIYERFLFKKIFAKEGVLPIPPILMKNFCHFGIKIRRRLEDRGFKLNQNLIESFSPLLEKVIFKKVLLKEIGLKRFPQMLTKHQKSAFFLGALAYLHHKRKTSYFGGPDGFLYLPKIFMWKKKWQEIFKGEFDRRDKRKYHPLRTNLF